MNPVKEQNICPPNQIISMSFYIDINEMFVFFNYTAVLYIILYTHYNTYRFEDTQSVRFLLGGGGSNP